MRGIVELIKENFIWIIFAILIFFAAFGLLGGFSDIAEAAPKGLTDFKGAVDYIVKHIT